MSSIINRSEAHLPRSGTGSNMNAAGLLLKEYRERKQWSIKRISQVLNLSEKFIESLESGTYDDSYPMVYIRGYFSNYARLVGLPKEELDKIIGVKQSSRVKLIQAHRAFSVKQVKLASIKSELLRWFKSIEAYQSWMYYGVVGSVGFLLLVSITYHFLRPFREGYQSTGVLKRQPVVVKEQLHQDKKPLGLTEPIETPQAY